MVSFKTHFTLWFIIQQMRISFFVKNCYHEIKRFNLMKNIGN